MKSKPASLSGAFSAVDVFERDHVKPKRGRTLIVGSQVYNEKEDRRRRYTDVVGIDMQDGPGVDIVADLEEPLLESIGTFAHIECMSVLEHSRRPWLLAANLERLMEPGGTIFVTIPFCWRYHGYPNDYWRLTVHGIRALFPAVEWQTLAYAHRGLTSEQGKIPVQKLAGFPYYPRTESVGFGVKRSA